MAATQFSDSCGVTLWSVVIATLTPAFTRTPAVPKDLFRSCRVILLFYISSFYVRAGGSFQHAAVAQLKLYDVAHLVLPVAVGYIQNDVV